MALALDEPFSREHLDALERHLGAAGLIQVEVTPAANPALPELLAERGYRIHTFQQVLALALTGEPAGSTVPGLQVREARPGEEELFASTLLRGFMGEEAVLPEMIALLAASARAQGNYPFMAWLHGEPTAGGSLHVWRGVATLSGTATLPRFRGQGVQAALIGARLRQAYRSDCDLAGSSTLPGTASQRNLERAGFRVVYPKVIMAKEPAGRL